MATPYGSPSPASSTAHNRRGGCRMVEISEIRPSRGLGGISKAEKTGLGGRRMYLPISSANNRLSVIDLKAKPPAVIATIETGLAPSGVAINRAATLALVANRGEGTMSIFTISGPQLTPAGKIDFGNPKASPSGVAISPDGKMALVVRDGDHKITVLSIDGTKVEDTKRMLTGGVRPYSVQISPKGDIAVVGNGGGGAGDIDTIKLLDLTGKATRVVHTLDVGQSVSGVTLSA